MIRNDVWIGILVFSLPIIASANELVIGVERAVLRDKPSFFGTAQQKLPYGAKVKLKKKQGRWLLVQSSKGTGWLDKSAFGSKKHVMRDIGSGGEVDSYGDDVALAGKGFSEEYESMYKSKNPQADFRSVDRMERNEAPTEKAVNFAKEGGLQ